MTHPTPDHGEQGHHGDAHLPEPSIWPLIAGAATLLLGLALVWWTRDRSNSISGPFMGAAAMATLLAAGGWATEDSRMRRKADRGELTKPREARYTQVVTFAIADGQLAAAQGDVGVLAAVESTDGALHNLAGFQDLRIILSPTEAGPTQVIVETTWSDREGLATYEETRQTLLDVVAAHPDEVVPGSVQVFDMQVVRDTKEMGFHLSWAPAALIVAAFVVGGFMVGAGLTLFKGESKAVAAAPAAAGGEQPAATGNLAVVATDNKFDKTSLSADTGKEITVSFKNNGKVPHNIHFLDKKGGATLAPGAEGKILNGGASDTLTFTVGSAGTYYFQCDVHPDQMTGQLVVK